MPLCECGCGQMASTGKRFVWRHSVVVMQDRNRSRVYSRDHLEKLWAGNKGKPNWRRKERKDVPCKCGCGQLLETPDNRGRERQFIQGHQTKRLVLKRKRPYPRKAKAQKPPKPPRQPMPIEVRKRISEKLKGPNSHLYRGGVSDERYGRIRTMEWRNLRRCVYERDNWQCVICGVHCGNRGKGSDRGKTIQCHHIIPARYGGEDEMDNLATVCVSCHRRQESLYGTSQYFWANKSQPTNTNQKRS